MKYRAIIFIFLFLLSFNVLAEDKAAKEDTTPPPMEGAMRPEQIPPIASLPQNDQSQIPKTS